MQNNLFENWKVELEYLIQYKAITLGSILSNGLVCLGHVVICPVVVVSAIYLGGEENKLRCHNDN